MAPRTTTPICYERHAVEDRGSGNSRNGSCPKMITTEIGEVEVLMPRDRDVRTGHGPPAPTPP
jgi:hypothetical protein